MCATHWARWRKHGDPARVIGYDERAIPPEIRFWAKVDKNGPGGCWVWTGALADTGYGIFNLRAKLNNTHRVAYEWLVGPIPDGMHLDHLCRVRACCNPAHLEPVGQEEADANDQRPQQQAVQHDVARAIPAGQAPEEQRPREGDHLHQQDGDDQLAGAEAELVGAVDDEGHPQPHVLAAHRARGEDALLLSGIGALERQRCSEPEERLAQRHG